MKHCASGRFWERYAALAEDIRALADKSYELLKNDPRPPSLHFKKLGNFGLCGSACTIGRWRSKSKMACCGSGSVRMQSMTASCRPNQRLAADA